MTSKEKELYDLNVSVPQDYINKIICGDSEEILKQLPDNCVDLIITSPPYNFGMPYDKYDDNLEWDKYFNNIFRIFNECIRVLKYGGRIVIDIKPCWSKHIPTHHIFSNYFLQKNMIWYSEILWEQNNYNCKYTAWGSYKSPSSPRFKFTWEFIEVFSKGTLKHIGNTNITDITAEEFKDWTVGKWIIAPSSKFSSKHPATYPEELVTRIIKMFSFVNDFIVDPFNGIGTTTTVAFRLKRQFLGIDISEQYCSIAEDRLLDEKLRLF